MLPGFAPPTNSHSIPTNPSRSLEFTVNGTSDDQNNTRIDGVSTAHIQLPHVASYVPTLESIEEVNVVTSSMDAEQGLAGGAAINVQTKSGTNVAARIGLRVLHQRAPESLADAVRRCRVEHRRQTGGELPPVRRHGRAARSSRTRRSTSSATSPRGTTGSSTTPCRCRCRRCSGAICRCRRRLSTTRCPGIRTAPGARSSRCLPGDPNYALCNTATNPGCLNIIPAAGWIRSRRRSRATFPANNIGPGTRQLLRVRAVRVRSAAGGLEGRLQREPELQSGRHVRRPALPNVGADRVRGRRRRASPSAAAAIPDTATATRTGSPSWAPTSSRRRS